MSFRKIETLISLTKGKKPLNILQNVEDSYLPYVDIKAFETGIVDNYTDGEKCVSCNEGDLLIVCDGSRSGLVGKAITGYVGSTLARIDVSDEIDINYLYYFIQGKYQILNTNVKGTGTPHLKQDLLKSFNIYLPPIEKQKLIVAKIEELFSKLDKGVEELNKIKEQLKIYRQAVLKEAFESYEKYDLYTLDNLMTLRNGYGKKPDDIGSFKILRISSVRPMKLNLQDYRVNRTKFDDNDIIAENDILFTRYNGSEDYVGVCACVPKLSEAYAYPDKIIKGTPFIKNKSHSKFLQFYLNYGDARAFIRSNIKTTSGQKGIAGSDLKKVIIRLPDIQTQERCVFKIERELSVCDKIEQTVNQSLQKAESLRQSILKKAFEGKLV